MFTALLDRIISALQLAALRGVDVRILVPAHADSQLVHLSSFTFLPELEKAGVQLNFEITLLFVEPSALRAAEAMFAADFARSTRATAADFTASAWWFRLAARTSRLMAPVQ